ncbi:MAG: amino acid permease [Propionibacteriaceae bacterium]|jgi:ethanolamine permease|nr:amino acid permease [Propionibacteriaceae bacterium]
MSAAQVPPTGESKEYFEQRALKQGAGGWVLLAGLGVAYVISGDFSGWNNGLATGGFGGLLIAFILMGIMYLFMIFGLAELSSALPTAGAGYGFARRAFGRLGGYMTGVAILIEYVIAPAAISVFICDYVRSIFGWANDPLLNIGIMAVFWVVFIGIQLIGAGEALKTIFVITAIAVVALVVYVIAIIPHFDASQLLNMAPDGSLGSSDFLPKGIGGALSTLVFGIWFFLGIEGVPLAAEEAKDPKKDMPRGLIIGMLCLLVFGALMLFLTPGGTINPIASDNPGLCQDIADANNGVITGTGSFLIGCGGAPLVLALQSAGLPEWVWYFVNIAGLAGLVASFFSLTFGASRQMFALSRAGYLPRAISKTSSRKVPTWCLLIPGIIGFALGGSLQSGARLIDIAVFGATVSYVMMCASHVWLRLKDKELHREYLTPGGAVTTGIATVLAVIAVIAVFNMDPLAAGITLGVFVVLIAYFLLYSSKKVVGNAPEEEFAAIAAAEEELN